MARAVAATASGDVRFALPGSAVVAGLLSTEISSDFPGRKVDRNRGIRPTGGAVEVRVDTAPGAIEPRTA